MQRVRIQPSVLSLDPELSVPGTPCVTAGDLTHTWHLLSLVSSVLLLTWPGELQQHTSPSLLPPPARDPQSKSRPHEPAQGRWGYFLRPVLGVVQTPCTVITALQHEVFWNNRFCAGFRSCWYLHCSNFPGHRAWSCPLVLSFMEQSGAAAIAEFALEGGLEAVLGVLFCTKFHQSQNLPFYFPRTLLLISKDGEV